MDDELRWFRELPADQRSWVTLVAQAGLQSFVEWLRSPDDVLRLTGEVFARRAAGDGPHRSRCSRPSSWSGRRSRSPRRTCPHRRPGRRATPCATSCCASAARSPSPPPASTRPPPRTAARGTPASRRSSSTTWSADRWCRRPAAQPARRARAGRTPARSLSLVGARPGRSDRDRARGGAHRAAPPRASTRWPACTPTGWSSSPAAARDVAGRGRRPARRRSATGRSSSARPRPECSDAARVTRAALSGLRAAPPGPARRGRSSADALLPERALAGDAEARDAADRRRLPAARRRRRRAGRDA